MPRPSKIGRNDRCPCLSGEKFKHCCSGQVDWEGIQSSNADEIPYLSVRGRNLYFLQRIGGILQLDKIRKTLKDYKAAFSTTAVREIHEAIVEIWPRNLDIAAVLRKQPDTVSGLYIGDYSLEFLLRAVVRHSVYANRILLFDPFTYAYSVRDEYNPILNPEQYRSQTLKNVNFWFSLAPWVEAGIVSLIRAPADFDPDLNWQLLQLQMKKFESKPELQKALEESKGGLHQRHTEKLKYQQLLLGAPDEYLRRKFKELNLGRGGLTVEEFLESVQRERDEDPDFLEPLSPKSDGQVLVMSSGASYSSATITANITKSYLFTDIQSKWLEIELDRNAHSAENKVWAPFAKAFQNTPLKYLNSLKLEHALKLRQENRLDSLRAFLSRLWKAASIEPKFDDQNAINLASELTDQVRIAEQEWKEIDRDLVKILGASAAAGLYAAGSLIAAGHGSFLASAAGVSGAAPLVYRWLKQRSFPDRFPAAFFMRIEDEFNK